MMGLIKIVFWGSETDCRVYKNFLEDDPNCICGEIVESNGNYGAKAEINLPEANI